jgi:hypothetical protein
LKTPAATGPFSATAVSTPTKASPAASSTEELRAEPDLRPSLLREAIGCMLWRDMETGKSVLRNYININGTSA